ncbi:MAG: undecaprenyl-diphosphatase UppP [Deltaproteobacteria bacterium]|nr:undecaprenyl-diphosphatase UppP [Candidatus Zymogenaceae bacterium]
MPFLVVIILGLIQGFTEFLPVSSSGHLVVAQHYLPGFSQAPLPFDVLLHLGTLVALIIYFFGDIRDIVLSFFRQRDAEAVYNRRLGWLIVIGTIPAGVVGLLFKDQIETLFSNAAIVPYMLIVTAVLLFVGERLGRSTGGMKSIGVKDAVIIGILQAVAIMPGISRSGSTIAGGLVMGLERDAAARFSFILSIPAVLGALVLSLGDISQFDISFVIGAAVACLAGLLAIWLTFRFVVAKRLWIFSLYLVIVGGSLIVIQHL